MNTTRCLSNDVARFSTNASRTTTLRCSDPGAVPAEALALLFPWLAASTQRSPRCATPRSIALTESVNELRIAMAARAARKATDEVIARFRAV